jgi:hypothetical protein
MQNSALFRRGVVMPLDQSAEEQLRNDNVSEATQVEWIEIGSQSLFDALWNLGLFQDINHRVDSLIDDYEQEVVESDHVGEIGSAVKAALSKKRLTSELRSFLASLSALAERAKVNRRPVFFVL